MKLTTFILIVSIMQVSAAGFGQKLTLKGDNITLGKVFLEIRKQTGYDVFFENTKLKSTTRIHADFVNTPLESVIEKIVAPAGLSYTISDKTIVIAEKQPGLLDRLTGLFSALDLRGKVIDSLGAPLPGASVRLKNSKTGVFTNAAGEFNLRDVQNGDVIVVSYIGYLTREITINNENASGLAVMLRADVGHLSEVSVVSTGYQTLPKERSAGSFAQVNMDVVANRTTSMNVLQSLDGLVPGLVVNNAPLKNQLLIRGLSTIGGAGNFPNQSTTAQPLYVVDGLAVPVTNDYDRLPDIILNLNPQDVESITVLKDATAASIWGARAANGVILIKTKSGAFGSKTRVTYNTFVNFQGKPELDYVPLLDSKQYVQTGVELFNAAHSPWQTISALKGGNGIPPLELILYNQERGLITADQAARQLDSLASMDNRGQIKDLFYRNAMLSNHTVSLSGGSDKYAFYGSASYTNTVSNVPGEKNQAYKVNVRQDIKAAKFLSLYVITDLTNNTASSKRNYNVDYFSAPYQMYRDMNGNNLSIPYLVGESDSVRRAMEARSRFNLEYNPLNEFDYGNTKSDGLMARLNSGLTLNIFKGLNFEGTYGYIKGKNKIREFESLQSFTVRREIAQFTVAATPTTVPKYYLPTNGGRMTTVNGDQHKWDIRNQLSYDNAFGKHEVTLLAGQEAQESFSTALTTRVRGFDESLLTQSSVDWVTIASPILNTVWPTISTLASSLTNDSFSTNETTNRYTSYYANASYTYDRRYAINTSWRNDQSNLFGKDKSAQNKPIWSIGGRWNISNEAFMKPVNWINRLAVRMSYGILGNSPNAGVAASQDITGPSGSAFFPGGIGLRVITPGNPDLSWERTATTNFGLDFSILRDRLSANIDLYNRKTTDLIGLVYPNSLTGYVTMVGNQGTMKNRGIEFNLNAVNVQSRNFSWTTNLIFAHNKNELIKLNQSTPVTTGGQQVVAQAKEGYPVFAVFAYKYAGLSNTGAPLITLADGSQSAARNISKPEDIDYMGTSQPVWNGGLGNTFQYKNFRLAANMVYNMGHVMRRERYLTINQPLMRNVHVDYLNRWRVPGDEAFTDIPGLVSSTANDVNYFLQGDNNVVDASFVKLRDITLFYDLPRSVISKIKAQGISFRVQMSNIMLWTANKYKIDPEFMGSMPSNQHTISLGANVSF